MTSLADLFPLLGLRVTAGPLELRGITDEDLAALALLAADGVHAPERMPFSFPWTDGTPEEVAQSVLQYHWRKRGELTPKAWSLELGVRWEGELVGIQGVSTTDFLVTRTGETGSWLGLRHHGKGIGTHMRQAICALLFDHLGFQEITSGAFLDNGPSAAVSRKVGYRPNGVVRYQRRDAMAEMQQLVLRPEDLVRGEPIEVEGAAAFRRQIGLD